MITIDWPVVILFVTAGLLGFAVCQILAQWKRRGVDSASISGMIKSREVRDASHNLADEIEKLKQTTSAIKKNPDALKDLTDRMRGIKQ